jgi:hypothetical protein
LCHVSGLEKLNGSGAATWNVAISVQ